MATGFKRMMGWLFQALFIVNLLVYLLTCLIPFLPADRYWYIAILAYIFPAILAGLLIFLIVGMVLRRWRMVLLTFVVILLGWKSVGSFFALRTGSDAARKKEKGELRILTWNVMRMVGIEGSRQERADTKDKALALIQAQDPDIICLQEFVHGAAHTPYHIIPYMADSAGYRYHIFGRDFEWFQGSIHQGLIIFSKYPILNSGRKKFPKPTAPQSLIWADIKKGSDTIRVYSAHLQSFRFNASDYQELNRIKTGQATDVQPGKKILSKGRHATANRAIQARFIREEMDKSPYPAIFCGDMNDVPASYTYFKVRGDWKDAYLEKGFGLGRTFSRLSPTLRIDYILTDPRFSTHNVYILRQRLSDHYGLVADLTIPVK